MKKLIIGLLALGSISAFAGEYDCKISVVENKCHDLSTDCTNPLVGEINFKKKFGAIFGVIFIQPISKKTNLFGKTVEEVNLVLEGAIQYGGVLDGSTFQDLYLSLDTTTYKRNIKTKRIELVHIKGEGTKLVTEIQDNYIVTGGCIFNPQS